MLKLNPYVSTMIQERDEKLGSWFFARMTPVRRVTCFVGKLRLRSGASERRNYLQSPTAVCGLRGSDVDFGFDNVQTYLNIYQGKAEQLGRVVRGFFADPGISAAQKSTVYQSVENAYARVRHAERTGSSVDKAQAQIAALAAVKVAAAALLANPAPVVKAEAQQTIQIVERRIESIRQTLPQGTETTVPTTTETTVETTTETTTETTMETTVPTTMETTTETTVPTTTSTGCANPKLTSRGG